MLWQSSRLWNSFKIPLVFTQSDSSDWIPDVQNQRDESAEMYGGEKVGLSGKGCRRWGWQARKKQKKKELYGCFDRKRWWLAWKGKI